MEMAVDVDGEVLFPTTDGLSMARICGRVGGVVVVDVAWDLTFEKHRYLP
tara:strand:- start:142 stop:291 length:150 start_codon:yes stop_codon:yes gene_type:complete